MKTNAAAVDPLSLILPRSVYQTLVEKWWPHVLKPAEIQEVVQRMSPADLHEAVAQAQALVTVAQAVIDAAKAVK